MLVWAFPISRQYPTIDEIDVFLNIDVQCILDVRIVPSDMMSPWLLCLLQEDTASAWGVKIVEPIVVFIRFKCMSLYLDGVGMCVYVHACVCMRARVCVHARTCVCACVYLCTCACMCVI